jgi:PPOX class probable F420-dependent enzyme
VVIDQGTELGARAARHLRSEIVAWMTTVTAAGAPLPRPVWFLWDGDGEAVVYSLPGARVRNIEANPLVTLNFAGDGRGGDIVVLTGRATAAEYLPPVAENPEYRLKYDYHIVRMGMTPESFGAKYGVPIRICFTDLSGH